MQSTKPRPFYHGWESIKTFNQMTVWGLGCFPFDYVRYRTAYHTLIQLIPKTFPEYLSTTFVPRQEINSDKDMYFIMPASFSGSGFVGAF